MAKLTLSDVTNLNNQTSSQNIINTNSDRIEEALENTLSRNGASPNQMNAELDMNNRRILNSPAPTEPSHLVRLTELDAVIPDIDAAGDAAVAEIEQAVDDGKAYIDAAKAAAANSAAASAASATASAGSASAAATSAGNSAASATTSSNSATSSTASAAAAAISADEAEAAAAMLNAGAANLAGGTAGQTVTKNSNADYDFSWTNPATGTGSVSSVAITMPTGFSVAGSPITEIGTLAITYAAGYQGFLSAQSTKLAGIATGATANDTDANLKNRANHTGTQSVSTITGLGSLATKSAVAIADITATGTPSSSNYLRGDGAWAAMTATSSVLDFGAVADATFNEGTELWEGTDNTAALQACIDYCVSNGHTIYIPAGRYFFTEGVTIESTGEPYADTVFSAFRPSVLGEGPRATQLYFGTGDFSGIEFLGGYDNEENPSFVSVGNLSLHKGDFEGIGLVMSGHYHCRLHDLVLSQWGTGLYCEDFHQSTLDNVVSVWNGDGGAMFARDTFTQPNSLLMTNCSWAQNGNYGLSINDPSALTIIGGTTEGNGVNGAATYKWGVRVIYNTGTTQAEGSVALKMIGHYLENNKGTADIWIVNPNKADIVVDIDSNSFQRTSSANFATNCILWEYTGTKRQVLNLKGNGLKSYNDYVPNSGRKYVNVIGGTNVEINSLGNIFGEATETPDFSAFPTTVFPKPLSSAMPVDFTGLLTKTTSGDINNGSTVAGSALKLVLWADGAWTTSGAVQSGTWLNVSGGVLGQSDIGYWRRVS